MTDRVISMKFTVRCEDLELTPKRASSHFPDDDSWLIEVLRREQEIFLSLFCSIRYFGNIISAKSSFSFIS